METKISGLIGRERPTVSFEFFPPKTQEAKDALMGAIDHLAEIQPDFVSVTYGAGGSTRALSMNTCLEVKSHTTGIVMAHLTGVCHTCEELELISDQLWESGIRNIMALRGDRPKNMDPNQSLGDFRFGKDLIVLLRSRHDFCLGSGCYPEGHTETKDLAVGIDHLKQKADAGCDFLVTQMFFDNSAYFRFLDSARAKGISLPIVPGIMPITGIKQVAKFEVQFGATLPQALKDQIEAAGEDLAEVERVGIEWTAGQCRELLAAGAPGIHFYTLNRSPSTVEVCTTLGLKGDPPAA